MYILVLKHHSILDKYGQLCVIKMKNMKFIFKNQIDLIGLHRTFHKELIQT
jgi:hypothetical protein